MPKLSRWMLPVIVLVVLLTFHAGPARAEEPPATPAPAVDEIVAPQIILKTQKAPVYPPAALAARFSGTVTVKAEVLPNGSVGEIKVVNCSHPNVGFEEASLQAVKNWKFEPAMMSGEPVPFTRSFRLNFRRSGSGTGPFVSSGIAPENTEDTPGTASSSSSAATISPRR